MGHQIEMFTFDENVDKKRVQKECDQRAAYAGYQEGCTGVTPIRWLDFVCTDYESAEQYIENHDRNWYDCLAVKYREYPQKAPTKTLINLRERLSKEQDKAVAYNKAHSITNLKAEFIGCSNCHSKLSKEYLGTSNKCPLCKTDLRGKTTIETLAKYRENISKLEKMIVEEQKKMNEKDIKKSKIKWLVKIEYHV